jgi:hypothetical protein
MKRIDVELDCNHDIVIKYGVAECQNCGLEESKILKRMYRRSTERKDRNGVEIFEGDYLVDREEYEDGTIEHLFKVVYCPRLMAWAIDISYARDGSQMISIDEFFGDCLEVKNPLPLTRS